MLLIAELACAVVFGLLVYRYDMYEREPWYMLALAVALGAGAYWILSYGEDIVLGLLAGGRTSLVVQAAVAAVSEELFKFLIVLAIWLAIPRHFNDPFDGLIYGAMAGLGFGLAESTFYLDLLGSELTWFAALGQESVRLLLHLLMGGLTCVGLGLARFRVPGWWYMLAGTVAAAILIHFCWDYFYGLASAGHLGGFQQRASAVGLMLAALFLFGVSVVFAARRSADEHAVNKLADLWGWPFRRFSGHRNGS